ncbi:hypothetical protein K458DRAFT_414070 [Lentithecium fluviatile CBS 122367]|uniref:Uncharacterized protein n=1 Tax=Lentithecium fluviatile CBS 122367 TaxID=1168545 RepID=A0A6G1JDT3_9PLEO|nr:hypothetical protein K458DRAFT_414070 [Lentithecium fluviatile CBS 122367]
MWTWLPLLQPWKVFASIGSIGYGIIVHVTKSRFLIGIEEDVVCLVLHSNAILASCGEQYRGFQWTLISRFDSQTSRRDIDREV